MFPSKEGFVVEESSGGRVFRLLLSLHALAHGKVLRYHMKMEAVCVSASDRLKGDCVHRRRQRYAELTESGLGVESRQAPTVKGNRALDSM